MDKLKIIFNPSLEDLEAEVNEFLQQKFILNVKSVNILSTNSARYCGYVAYVHYSITTTKFLDQDVIPVELPEY